MPDPNSSLVDDAVVQRLVNDATLQALMPDGVYFNVARKDATRFVVLEVSSHTDAYGFNFEAWQVFRYLIKAVALNSNGSDVAAAADRINVLLQDAMDLPIAGYQVMRSQRTQYVRYLDVDPEILDPLAISRRLLRSASDGNNQYRARGSRARRDQIRGGSWLDACTDHTGR